MEKMKKSNRAPLLAAALVITGATAIFGTYASEEVTLQDVTLQGVKGTTLSEEQKNGLEEVRALFKEGKTKEAKTLLDNLGLNKLDGQFIFHEKRKAFMDNLTEEQKVIMEEAHELMKGGKEEEAKTLLKANNIDLPERMEIKLSLTEEQKARLQEAKKLKEAGDIEGAKAIMEELGLPSMNVGFHMGGKLKDIMLNLTDEQKAKMEEAHELMENGEEEKVKAIFEEISISFPEKHFMKMNLTEEQKEVMKKAHELMKEGKKEEAQTLLKEAGIEMPRGHNFMFKFHEELTDEQKAGMEKVRDLFEAGNKEEAQKMMESLDLPTPPAGKMLRWMDKGEEFDIEINNG